MIDNAINSDGRSLCYETLVRSSIEELLELDPHQVNVAIQLIHSPGHSVLGEVGIVQYLIQGLISQPFGIWCRWRRGRIR